MTCRRPSSRWALWAFAAALLLKSAMPWLASASAQMQGKALVEVCSVYGVSLVPLNGDVPPHDGREHASEHGQDHCMLTALAAFADAGSPPLAVAAVSARVTAAAPSHAPSRALDAQAGWAARLGHGPPRLT